MASIGVASGKGISPECVVEAMQTEGRCGCVECDSAWFWALFVDQVDKQSRGWSFDKSEVLGDLWMWVTTHPEDVAHRWNSVPTSLKDEAMYWTVKKALDRGVSSFDHYGNEVPFSSLDDSDTASDFLDVLASRGVYVG